MSIDNKFSLLDNMIVNMLEKIGKSLQEWVVLLGLVGVCKYGELMKVFKGEYGLIYGYVNLVVYIVCDSMFLNDMVDDLVVV